MSKSNKPVSYIDRVLEIIEDWADDIVSFFHRGVYRICHIYSWLPIIWNDSDWDHAFLYIVLRHKIKRMRARHEKHRVISDWKKVAGQLKTVELALDRLIDDGYMLDQFMAIQKKYGRPEEFKEESGLIRLAPMSKAQSKEVRAAGKREMALRDKDMDAVFDTMREHIQEWWD